MYFAGMHRVSLSDFPGHVAAIAFTQGCNLRCPYCHNPHLLRQAKTAAAAGISTPEPRAAADSAATKTATATNGATTEPAAGALSVDELLAYLRARQGRLTGLVVTGGEPTMHCGLPTVLQRVKELGYAIKLDTNGSRPEVLGALLDASLVDYVAMDVKAPLHKYALLTGTAVDADRIKQSIDTIIASGVHHEFRTTTVAPLLDEDDLVDIAQLVAGASRYVLQAFRDQRTYDADLATAARPFAPSLLAAVSQRISSTGLDCRVRH